MLTAWRITKNFFLFLCSKWRIVLPIIVIIVVGFYLRSCWSAHKAKLNEKQIEEAKIAIEQHNDEKLKEVFAQADTKQAVIDGTVANSEADTKKAEAEAKKKYDAMTNDELAAELEARK